MARSNHIVNSFVAGEASPKFLGRTDAQQYNQCCEDTLNAMIYPQGGFGRRPGTGFVSNLSVLNSIPSDYVIQNARVIPFSAAGGRRFQIVLMNCFNVGTSKRTLQVAVFNAANLQDVTITRASNTGLIQNGFTGFDLTNYHDGSAADPFGPIAEDLDSLDYAQSGDVMVLTGNHCAPFVIAHSKAVSTSSFVIRYYVDEAYHSSTQDYEGVPFDALQSLTGSNTWAVTTTAAPGDAATMVWGGSTSAGGGYIDYNWVGRIIRFSAASKTIVVGVTSDNGTGTLTGVVLGGAINASPTTFGNAAGTSYEYSAWGGSAGYPKAVCFFEGRLVFGGGAIFSDTAWFSQIGNIYKLAVRKLEQDTTFADPITASYQFEQTLKSDLVGRIQWMLPAGTITVGTNFREFIVYGPDSSQSIGPTNTTSKAETPHGSAYAKAVRVENTTVFLQRDRRTLRELVYSLEEDSFKADTLNTIAEHIAKKSTHLSEDVLDSEAGTFRQIVVQQTPFPIVWARDNKGKLCGMTRDRAQQVVAWHYHELAGESTVGADPFMPFIHSLSVVQIPGDCELDELWMVVSRGMKVAGNWVEHFFLERMHKDWEGRTLEIGEWALYDANDDDARDEHVPVYLDCAVFATEAIAPTGEIGALPMAGEDQEVSVILNGVYLGEKTVDSAGKINIAAEIAAFGLSSWTAMIGFNYLANVVPTTPEVPAQLGSSQGQPRSVTSLDIHFYRSVGAKFGRYASSTEDDTPVDALEEIPFPEPGASDEPYSLFTGAKRVEFPSSIDTRPKVQIQSHLPFPCQVTHVVANMVVYEG